MIDIHMKFRVWLEAVRWSYLGQCDRVRQDCAGGEGNWQYMIENAVKVPLEELGAVVDVTEIMDEDETWNSYIEDNPDAIAYKSMWGDKPCYFLQTAGFEFIWVSPE